MPKQKPSTVKLQVFKGRETKLNKTIFHILAQKGPQTIYDIYKQVKAQRGLRHTRYASINRRVRLLEEQGYVRKIGARESKTGSQASLYELAGRAYLAILLNSTDLDRLVMNVDDVTAQTILASILEIL